MRQVYEIMSSNTVPSAVIRRMPRYYRYLGDLLSRGITRISSADLSRRMNVTASQIRQDLNNFGGFGQQGYGYNVRHLYDEIGSILGLDKKHNLILIGAGNLGQALANYVNFEKRGFIIKGIFDRNEDIHGREIRGIRVQPMENIEQFMKENDVDIAVLTIPKTGAVKIAEQLASYGIRGIWNFAHIDLNLPENIKVENVHLSESLMKLSYKMNASGKEK